MMEFVFMDSKLAEMAPTQVARWQMLRTMVSEPTSNSLSQRSRNSIQETGATRPKTTSSTLSPSTGKSDCSLVPIFFSTEVAESEFRTQPVATVVSATGGVRTTPTCTRADAHFSRAHITVHNPHIDLHFFQCCHIGIGIFTSLSCPCWMSLSSRFPPVASSPISSLSRPSASWTSLQMSRTTPCASARWSGRSGCLANPTPHTNFEPNFYTNMNEEHTPFNLPDSHRNFPRSDDATIISTTEDPEGSKPQQAEFPQC